LTAEAQVRRQTQPVVRPAQQNNAGTARLTVIPRRDNKTAPAPTPPAKNNGHVKSNGSPTATGGNVIPAKSELTYPRNHVLLAGVNKYPPKKSSTDTLLAANFPELSFCVRDMERLAKSLVAAHFCRDEDIYILVSGDKTEPTSGNVRATFEALLAKIQPDDSVLIAFSGSALRFRWKGTSSNRRIIYVVPTSRYSIA
jgi:hypothetical protein